MNKNTKILLFILLIAVVVFGVWRSTSKDTDTTSSQESNGEVVTGNESNNNIDEGMGGAMGQEDIPEDVLEHINDKFDLIRVESPAPMSVLQISSVENSDTVDSSISFSGSAVGTWFFEGDFPVMLTDWNGLIVGEGYASAVLDPSSPDSTWMTDEFVPFTSTISFKKPEISGDFARRGFLIFQKANASGLPEHDDALEIPIFFE